MVDEAQHSPWRREACHTGKIPCFRDAAEGGLGLLQPGSFLMLSASLLAPTPLPFCTVFSLDPVIICL